jgi:glycosyltransferase involved in cell wall biosynthesis
VRAHDLAREVRANIIQSHSYKPHLIALALRKLSGMPWIGFHHGWTAENLKVRAFHSLDRFTLPRADRIVAVSRDSERLVLEAGCPRERTVMITNAVDAADFACGEGRAALRAAWGIPVDATLASAIGRLSPEKGQDVLVEAFARIATERPTLHIALAGDGPERATLEARVRALGIADRVHFLGHQHAVGRVYAASDFMVLPSRSEGMPNALLEAMATRTAAIATRVGGVPEVAVDGENAWLVPSEDPDAMASALRDAHDRPDERARRADRAYTFVTENLSPARRADRFVALYRELLRDHAFASDDAPRESMEVVAP